MKTNKFFNNTSFIAVSIAAVIMIAAPKAHAQFFSGGEAPKPTQQCQTTGANTSATYSSSYNTQAIRLRDPIEPIGYSRVHTTDDVPNHYRYTEINGHIRTESVQRCEYTSREVTERPTIIGQRDTVLYRTVSVTTNITTSSYVPYYGTSVDVKFAKDAPQASYVEGGGQIAHAIVNSAIKAVTPQKAQR
jgi:hypothetical protein